MGKNMIEKAKHSKFYFFIIDLGGETEGIWEGLSVYI